MGGGRGHLPQRTGPRPGARVLGGHARPCRRAPARAAEEAFWSYGYSSREERAAFLEAIADEIEARGDAITDIGSRESGLPPARLQGERGRTIGQLRLFASHIRKGDYLDRRHDAALPDRQPLPRPDLKMIQRPDRARSPCSARRTSRSPSRRRAATRRRRSPRAAPWWSRATPPTPARARSCPRRSSPRSGAPACTPASSRTSRAGGATWAQAVVQHPLIRAVGFTGSLAGGRALFDLCAAAPRPDPVLRRARLGQPDVPPPRRRRRARGGDRQGLGRVAHHGRGSVLHQSRHRRRDRRTRRPTPSSRRRRPRLSRSARRPC